MTDRQDDPFHPAPRNASVDALAWGVSAALCLGGGLGVAFLVDHTFDAASDAARDLGFCHIGELNPQEVAKAAESSRPSGPAQSVIEPRWIRRPAPYYPEEAVATTPEGESVLRSGAVSLVCRVNEKGRFEACAVLASEPKGLGFEQASLSSLCRARLSPKRIDGEPQSGLARFTVRFRRPDLQGTAAIQAG